MARNFELVSYPFFGYIKAKGTFQFSVLHTVHWKLTNNQNYGEMCEKPNSEIKAPFASFCIKQKKKKIFVAMKTAWVTIKYFLMKELNFFMSPVLGVNWFLWSVLKLHMLKTVKYTRVFHCYEKLGRTMVIWFWKGPTSSLSMLFFFLIFF